MRSTPRQSLTIYERRQTGMGSWLTKQVQPSHLCSPPMREVWVRPPAFRKEPEAKRPLHRMGDAPDGTFGDRWECDCGKVWRIGRSCDFCDRCKNPQPHRGCHVVGHEWRETHHTIRELFTRRKEKNA